MGNNEMDEELLNAATTTIVGQCRALDWKDAWNDTRGRLELLVSLVQDERRLDKDQREQAGDNDNETH